MSERNPWKLVYSKDVYTNPWMRVREDQVIRPDGKSGIYGVMSARYQSVGVVALGIDRKITLVGQFRYPLNAYSWEIPEGGTHPEETPCDAARRELAEETGMVAGRWSQLGEAFYLSNSITDEVAWAFLAEDLREVGSPTPDATEILTQRRIPLAQVIHMCVSGEISDALTIIAVMRAAVKLRCHVL